MTERSMLGINLEKFGFTLDDFIADIEMHISQRIPRFYASVNLHAFSIIQKDTDYLDALNSADKIRFDGVAAIWLARISGTKKPEKIGSDVLMNALYPLAEKEGWSLYFLGGHEGAVEQAAKWINIRFPQLKIAGTHHGYFDPGEEREIINEINELSPNILIVGIGMPNQEKWISKNKKKLKVDIITNCGGYIEQIAEKGLGYFPDWVNKYHLSWLLRILREPQKFGVRYLFEGIVFFPVLLKTVVKSFLRKNTRF